MATKTIWLPFPRVATVTFRRSAQPEAIALCEDLPLVVPDLGDAEAPVAIAMDTGNGLTHYREHGGGLHRPFMSRDGATPEEAGERLRQAIGDIRDSRLAVPIREHLYHLNLLYAHVSGKRGVRPESDHAIAVVHDDGRAEQETARARAETNLVLVDGLLQHRCPVPRLTISVKADSKTMGNTEGGFLNWPPPGDRPSVLPAWTCFPVGREAEATGFAEAVEDMRLEGSLPYLGRFELCEIQDREAYLRAGCEPAPEAFAKDCARDCVGLGAGVIGHYGDHVIARYLHLRDLVGRGTDPTASMLDLATVLFEAPRPDRLPLAAHADVVLAMRALVLRMESYELTSDLDDAALRTMAP